MRASYGENLRKFLLQHVAIEVLIDLSDCDIFDSATVLTNILMYKKEVKSLPTKTIRFIKKDQEKLKNLKLNFDNEAIFIDQFPESSWIISNNKTFEIKSKVESQGKILKNWNIVINRGVLTGYNDAFIINEDTKNELILKDPKSVDFIKPLLRGRDINKYYPSFQDLWLINIPKGFTIKNQTIEVSKVKDNEVSEPTPRYGYVEFDEAWDWFQKRLPAIANHLLPYKSKAEKRTDMGDYWWELRACSYLEDFLKPKIIYPNMTKFLPFIFDKTGYYINQKCYLITGDDIEYLVSILNSKLFKFCFGGNFPELQGNAKELNKVIFEQIPIKQISKKMQKPFIKMVEQIHSIKNKKTNNDTSSLEAEIDQMIYRLYDLTDEEIEIVEGG